MLKRILMMVCFLTLPTNPVFADNTNEFEHLIFLDDCVELKEQITLTYLSFKDAETELLDRDKLLSPSTVEMQRERYLDEASKLAQIYGVICATPLMKRPLSEAEQKEKLRQKLIKDGLITE